jgi:hypothetical protein
LSSRFARHLLLLLHVLLASSLSFTFSTHPPVPTPYQALEHSREYFEPFCERLLLRLPPPSTAVTNEPCAAADDAARKLFERRQQGLRGADSSDDGDDGDDGDDDDDDDADAGAGLGSSGAGGGGGAGWRAMSASSVAASGSWRGVAAAAQAEVEAGIVDRPGTLRHAWARLATRREKHTTQHTLQRIFTHGPRRVDKSESEKHTRERV